MRLVWRKIRNQLRGQSWLAGMLASLLAAALRFINWTNPQLPGTLIAQNVIRGAEPAIIALWHGQHLMASFVAPKGMKFVALYSRSADAELNALVSERLGIEVIRGSGGRAPRQDIDKGGARALLLLKRALDQGKSVVMIADISKSTPRQAGEGIVLLSKISGRPIIPAAYASSRSRTIARSWDKMSVNLPFGRAAACASEPLIVPRRANGEMMRLAQLELTSRLNDATQRARAMVGGKA